MRRLILGVAVLVLVGMGQASADIYTTDFVAGPCCNSGVVFGLDSTGGFTGSFTLDTNAPYTPMSSNVRVYHHSIVDGFQYFVDNALVTSSQYDVTIIDDFDDRVPYGMSGDQMYVFSATTVYISGNPMVDAAMGVGMYDFSATAFNDASLPGSLPFLYDSAFAALDDHSTGAFFEQHISWGDPVVPEPSTFIIWSMLGAGGLLTYAWRKRRRR